MTLSRQRIQLRRDTSANWAARNPVLLEGEAGYVTDTNQIKVGDGTTSWNALPYLGNAQTTLSGLSDVDAQYRIEGSVLVYNEASAKFVAGPQTTTLELLNGGNF